MDLACPGWRGFLDMIHCQSCTTRNAMTLQFCWKCGTKLLVTSKAARSNSPMGFMDEDVLERLSAMEYALSAMNRRLDALVDTIERVVANNFVDHAMIETLTESIESAGINLASIENEWRKRVDSKLNENDAFERLGERMERIIQFYEGSRRKQFVVWIEQAYDRIAQGRTDEGLDSLNSAYREDPANYELGMLLAEVLFDARDLAGARRCLTQVLVSKPGQFEATLLKGLIEKLDGHLEDARRLLEDAVRLRDDSPSAHATLGSLLADSGNPEGAIQHLERALELKPTALAHFMLGAAYYREGRQRRAIDHLKQATELDPEFDEAFYQLGLLCFELNWMRKAEECFRSARKLNPEEDRYRHTATGFSEGPSTPDQLNWLVRDELQLTTGALDRQKTR